MTGHNGNVKCSCLVLSQFVDIGFLHENTLDNDGIGEVDDEYFERRVT